MSSDGYYELQGPFEYKAPTGDRIRVCIQVFMEDPLTAGEFDGGETNWGIDINDECQFRMVYKNLTTKQETSVRLSHVGDNTDDVDRFFQLFKPLKAKSQSGGVGSAGEESKELK